MLNENTIQELELTSEFIIKHRPLTSWLLFRWGKDVFDNQDQKIMIIEHTFLSKIAHIPLFLIIFGLYSSLMSFLYVDTFVLRFIFFLFFLFLSLSFFFRQKKFVIKDMDQKVLGTISCNWRNSKWKITDHLKNPVATVYFTKKSYRIFRRIFSRGEIVTPFGSFILSPFFTSQYTEGIFSSPKVSRVTVDSTTSNSGFEIHRRQKISWSNLVPTHHQILITSKERNNLFFYLITSFCIVEKMLSWKLYLGNGD